MLKTSEIKADREAGLSPFNSERGDRLTYLEAAVLAAEEMAIDLSITADNAASAAKTDPRWEGVAEKLRARVAAYREHVSDA